MLEIYIRSFIRYKEKIYAKTLKNPLRRPWFSNFPTLSRGTIAQLCRLRSGHCLTPCYLHRIRKLRNQFCEYEEIRDLNDKRFGCPLNNNCSTFYFALYNNLKIPAPIDLSILLTPSLDPSLVTAFCTYMTSAALSF